MLILSERAYRRSEAVLRLEEWLRDNLRKASGGEAKVKLLADGWIGVEADDETLLASIIKLNTELNPIISSRPPIAARIAEVGREEIAYAYPGLDGLTRRGRCSISELMAQLGLCGEPLDEVLEAAGLVEGSAISLTLDSPSSLQLDLLREDVQRGLDRVLLIDLAPGEVEELLSRPLVKNLIAYHRALTLLIHVIYIKLGARLDKAFRKLSREAEKLFENPTLKPLSWRKLIKALKPRWAGWELNPRPPPREGGVIPLDHRPVSLWELFFSRIYALPSSP